MGANLTKETQDTWNQEKVEKWKLRAIEILKSYYLSFRGSQFDEYMVGEDENLLLAKICFAIYGAPTVHNAKEIWDAYEEKQLESAKEILKIIIEVHKKKRPSAKQILVGIIFIACKQEDFEYIMPIFSVFTGHDPYNPHASRSYVDSQKRTYDSWNDWKSNNTMPMLKYAYPRRGFFTSSPNHNYEFDEAKEPDIEFDSSPACSTTSRVLGTTDTITGITALGCGVVGLASMFTPIGPSVLVASMYGGISSAIYGSTRAAVRLHDKGAHGESLTDLESFALVFSIIATPLHFTSSLVNAQLIRGAVVNGRIFSNSMRMFATFLNFSTLGVDGVMLAFGIANLIDKAKQDQLKPLDILQFSMSVFFFTNTLIRPQMASSIIKNAQEAHIQNYSNNLSDADAQATFNKFIEANKGDGGIKDTSKIIRTINRINDPNKIFGDLKGSSDIKIGGRKGKTLLVKQDQNVERINPSKMSSVDAKVQPTNIVGSTGIVDDDKEEKIDKIADKVVKQTGKPGIIAKGTISTIALTTLSPYLKKLKEKFESMDVSEIIDVLYEKVLKEYPDLVNEIQSTVLRILGIYHRQHHPAIDYNHQNRNLQNMGENVEVNHNENDRLLEEKINATENVEIYPQELVNIDTTYTLGGLCDDLMNLLMSNDEFEINLAPPRDFFIDNSIKSPPTAFLMLKSDYEIYQSTGREGILTLMNDLKIAIKMEITLLNTRKLLPKYAVGIFQWIEKVYDTQLLTRDEYIEILDHFQSIVEACEKTGNYDFSDVEMQEIEIFFYRLKATFLFKKFVIDLSIVKDSAANEIL